MRKIFYTSILLATTFVAGNGVAQSPDIVSPSFFAYRDVPVVSIIGGDDAIGYGEMIVLRADVSNVPEDATKISLDWTVLDFGKDGVQEKLDILTWPDGTQVFWAAGINPKQFVVFLDVDVLYTTDADDGHIETASIDGSPGMVSKTITVGSGPAPNPNPDPEPNPDDFGRFGIGKVAYDSIVSHDSLTAREKASLSSAYDVAFQSAASTIMARQDLNTEEKWLSTANEIVASKIQESQVPAAKIIPIQVTMKESLMKLERDGKINTKDDYAEVFREIAKGFAAAMHRSASTVIKTLRTPTPQHEEALYLRPE